MRTRIAALAALLVLTGCTSEPAPTPPRVSPPAGPSTAPPPTGAGRPVTFRSVHMVLPAGWKLRDQGYRACLDPVTTGGCTAEVALVDDLVGEAGGRRPSVSAADGWAFTPEDRACAATGVRIEGRTLSLPTGPAGYARWRVDCSGRTFSPRLWLLAGARIAVRQRAADQATDPVVDRLVAGIRTG
jgi:hypothetical protein